MKRLFLILALMGIGILIHGPCTLAAGEQLPNLPQIPTSPRFTITDRVWPTQYGGAGVCLWADDKLAAVSFTIDDNCSPEWEFWKGLGQKYGWRFTWFIVTGLVDVNPTSYGTWAGLRDLNAQGHDIQSHTVNHYNDGNSLPDSVLEQEYQGSIEAIEANIPGHKVKALGYPACGGNTQLVNEYFAVARECSTYGPGVVNKLAYMNLLASDHFDRTWLGYLLDPSSQYYRGWAEKFHHSVYTYGDDMRPPLHENMEFIKAHEADFWVGTFTDVALYGQERDTHTLTVHEVTSTKIVFELTDRMKDDVFDYPLTVKVCLGASPGQVGVTQNGAGVSFSLVTHGGLTYALVKAVPDKGLVTVTTDGSNPPPSLTVTSPNGSETWQVGTTHDIAWNQTGLSGNVTVDLYKGLTLSGTLGAASASAGKLTWAVPANQAVGSDYKARIYQGNIDDYSDKAFSIVNIIPTNHTVTVNHSSGGHTNKDGTNTVAAGGSLTVTATADSGYAFSGWTGDASGAANPLTLSNVTRNMTITASFKQKPGISAFTATPAAISPGQSSVLKWTVSNADSVSIGPGVGDVTESTEKSVRPTATTTYTLTAKNQNGDSSTRAVTVTVQGSGGGGGDSGGDSGGGSGGGGGCFLAAALFF